MNLSSKIYVAGHKGMVGGTIVRHLVSLGYENIITRERSELDLGNQAETRSFFADCKPDIVIMAAAKVGGIHANITYPATFLYENLAVATNTIDSALEQVRNDFFSLPVHASTQSSPLNRLKKLHC